MNITDLVLQKVHISEIKAGDTVILNGQIKTVNEPNIGRCSLLGTTLWGDSYHSGSILIERVLVNSAGCIVYK